MYYKHTSEHFTKSAANGTKVVNACNILRTLITTNPLKLEINENKIERPRQNELSHNVYVLSPVFSRTLAEFLWKHFWRVFFHRRFKNGRIENEE